MDIFEYNNSHRWAWEKGFRRKCQKHGIEYDPHIFDRCPKCLEEEKEREVKAKRLKETFDRIIWPRQEEEL